MARVFAYERAGHGDAAVRELRQLLRERPGDAVVQNALGYSLADQDRQLGEARTLIAAALVQTPDSAAVLDSMGWVLFREGVWQRRFRISSAPGNSATTRNSTCTWRGAVGARRPGCGTQDLAGRTGAPPGCHRAEGAPGASRPVRRGAICLLAAVLAGCAVTQPMAPFRARGGGAVRGWTASGRMALAADGEGGSGSFTWRQQGVSTYLSIRVRSELADCRSPRTISP